jgi:hypothetical protein
VTAVNPAAVRVGFDAHGRSTAERYDPGDAVEPAGVAETTVLAAERAPSVAHEVDVHTGEEPGGT